ncbi:hypothetical protein [Streptomyces sp. H27-C3]|uniref:hypothetical protein n=1 Tax=Streptomyces sp. H27-C3 TaxID=3046305 RepID=UPI0024B88477|nr:hypothetical protein [Streptomyces sp. H27-C3]MDJ0460836.1 hypothetical protein [Streptomyces sp. H27-C3]
MRGALSAGGTKTSSVRAVSPGARFDAYDVKAATRPSALVTGQVDESLPRAPGLRPGGRGGRGPRCRGDGGDARGTERDP